MNNKGMEALLQEVIDREAIRTLPALYCHYIWQGNVDGYVNLFTDDGTISTSNAIVPDAHGGNELRKMITDVLDTMKSKPLIHNHVVELLGSNQAKGYCYLEVTLLRDGNPWKMVAWYDDAYVKIKEEWKFKSRKITVDSLIPLKES